MQGGPVGVEDGDELTQGVRRALELSRLESDVWAAIKVPLPLPLCSYKFTRLGTFLLITFTSS